MKRLYSLVLFVLVLSVILSGCPKKDYKPCSIEILSPVRGSVISPDSGPVTITGRVVNGDSEPIVLKVNRKKIDFDKTTGAFTYSFQPDSTLIFNTLEFSITDKKLISNLERISFPVGQSMKAGDSGVVDNALRVHFDQDLIDLVISQMNEVINSVTKPLVYGPVEGNEVLSMIGITEPLLAEKFYLDVHPLGEIYIDKDISDPELTGLINIGNIQIIPDIAEGNRLLASVVISPTEGVNPKGPAALFIQGCHHEAFNDHHIGLGLNQVKISNAEITLFMDSEGEIGAKLDLTNGKVEIDGIQFEYGVLSLRSKVFDWLTNTIINQYLVKMLSIDFPFMNVSDFSFNFLDIGLNIWPMNPSIITTTADDLNLDLGISAVFAGVIPPSVPGLDTFYATPGDALPVLDKISDENIMIAISDDMMNEAALALIQTDLIRELDMDDVINGLVSSISNEPAEMDITLLTPPILDFSGKNPKNKIFADVTTSLGCVMLRDLLIEIRLKAGNMPLSLRMNIDADAYLMLKVKESGNIGVTIDTSKTDFSFKILYMNGINTIYLPAFGRLIVNAVLPPLLDSMVDISPPAFDLIGKNISIQVVGTEAKSNYLIGRAKLIIK